MLSHKNIFIVNCPRNIFDKNFYQKNSSMIINPYKIKQRLISIDIDKSEPSSEIINGIILKKLNLFKNCKNTEFLYILKEDLDENFILNFKLFFNRSNYNILYHLLSISDNIQNTLINQFDRFSILEFDDKKPTARQKK